MISAVICGGYPDNKEQRDTRNHLAQNALMGSLVLKDHELMCILWMQENIFEDDEEDEVEKGWRHEPIIGPSEISRLLNVEN